MQRMKTADGVSETMKGHITGTVTTAIVQFGTWIEFERVLPRRSPVVRLLDEEYYITR